MSGASTPVAGGETPSALDERDSEPRTPMRRLGSTRKLAAFNNIRVQLCEQTRVLEARAEAAAGVAGELHEYCRRRAELEHEYSRALDKLARGAASRHKEQRHKRELWPLVGAFACWQTALENTRALSRDHAALAELYGGRLAARLQRAADDALRLHRKCRDVVAERHEEVAAALAEAAAAAKAHAAAAADWRAAALKLRHAHDRAQQAAGADPPRTKKAKALDKEVEKRLARHSEARARARRARAEYALSLEAANATLQRYYSEDVADVMAASEAGFEAVVGRAVRCAAGAEGARARELCSAGGTLLAAADALDALAERARLTEAHASAFAVPRPLTYAGASPDVQDAEMRALTGDAAPERDALSDAADEELSRRLQQLELGARALRAECREHAKTLDAAEAELVRQMEGEESSWDVSEWFGAKAAGAAGATSEADATAAEAARREQEEFFLSKLRAYAAGAGRLARLEGKASAAGRGARGGRPAAPSSPLRASAARRGRFAAPLDARALPRVLTECVRVIGAYGARQQGVFRVSGSQAETLALRAAFERGEDALAGAHAGDVNSVCGLLKLYLRELRPPLLPPALQERLLRLAALPEDAEFCARLREVLATLPLASVLVLRYLFAFLAALTRHSARTMMDAWNLAVCLGPTLLAAWGEGGAQVAAQNLVNELVKRIILLHRDCFPQDVAPHTLYRPPDELCDDGDSEGDGDEPRPPRPDDAQTPAVGEAPAAPTPAESPAPVASVAPAAPADACRRLAESTPDLVLDLPARAAATADPTVHPTAAASVDSSVDSSVDPSAEPPVDAADTFLHNRDTLKKRPPHKQTSSEGECEAGEGGEAGEASEGEAGESARGREGDGGSPVPLRNTARVAAKFAELTLTGGSLKPALAAKPALLRRPTPHPRPAAPVAPVAPMAPMAPADAV